MSNVKQVDLIYSDEGPSLTLVDGVPCLQVMVRMASGETVAVTLDRGGVVHGKPYTINDGTNREASAELAAIAVAAAKRVERPRI
jgi:hypothetical protein